MEISLNRAAELIKEKGILGATNHIYKVIFNRFKETSSKILLYIFKRYFIKKLKRFKSSNISDVVEYAEKFCFGSIKPSQIKTELIELLKKYVEINPKYILEIGTGNKGGTLFCLCKLAPDSATIISIDLPGGPFGGGYPKWKTSIYKAFAKEGQSLHLLRMDSHKEETVEEIKKILNGNSLDFIFIDGDHSYDGVKKDYEMYRNLVKIGGIIAFHDIVQYGDPNLVGGVPRFWNELKEYIGKNIYSEIIHNASQEGYGIGIIKKQREDKN